jgi:hypothetical protein
LARQIHFKRAKFRTDKNINNIIIIIKMPYKNIPVSEKNHAVLINLKHELKCRSFDLLIGRLIIKARLKK